jgi:hypothetical protein
VATLVDARLVGRTLVLVDPDRPGVGFEIDLHRLEIASEDGEVEWCRMAAAVQGTGWPPEPAIAPRSRRLDLTPMTSNATVEVTLGLAAEHLPLLDGRDAADVVDDLWAGKVPEMLAPSSWYPLVTRLSGSEPDATAWVTQPLLGHGPPPEPVSPLLARMLAVLFEEGWEPRRSAAAPDVVVAAVEPEDGWTLTAAGRGGTGEVTVEVVLPDDPPWSPGDTAEDGLATFEVGGDGMLRVIARVHAVDAALPSESFAGMIDAVLDSARGWAYPDGDPAA